MMRDRISLPGLRQVLVHVTLGSVFPPTPNSEGDIGLLRAANHALQRQAMGTEDSFLFLLFGDHNLAVVQTALRSYGFANSTVILFTNEEDTNSEAEFDPLVVERLVKKWLAVEHPGSVAAFTSDYAATDFWWMGLESLNSPFEWSFNVRDFADTLPYQQKSKAETWLTIMAIAMDFDYGDTSVWRKLRSQQSALWAVTLCAWLHGFGAASEDDSDMFDHVSLTCFQVSDFFLGFQLGRLARIDIEPICNDNDVDVDELQRVALKSIIASTRYELRAALSDFFGGDSGLFWALYSEISPNYGEPMVDALDRELGSSHPDDLARLEAVWRFVTEGSND